MINIEDAGIRSQLQSLVESLRRKDKVSHEELIREFKRNINYYHDNQRLFLDRAVQDWRVATHVAEKDLSDVGATKDDFGRQINIVKPHGQSIISALSAAVPIIRFLPKDADSADDILTARVYADASDLIDKHNNAQFLQRYGLYILWNQSFIASYTYNHASKEYGEYATSTYDKKTVKTASYTCPGCESSENPMAGLIGEEPVQDDKEPAEMMHNCETCGYQGPIEPSINTSEELIRLEDQFFPKSRQCIEFYGRLNVQLPINIKKLSDAPYLILEREQHYAFLRKMYPKFADQIKPGASSITNNYNRTARTPVDLTEEVQSDYNTHSLVWLRPWAFYALGDNELAQQLEAAYPDGALLCFVDDLLVDIEAENMDEYWTITESPTSDYIDDDPLVKPLIEIQESTNDVYSLIEETVRQSIPDVFADPNVLNFQAYASHTKRSGAVFPAIAKPGQNLDQSFYSIKTASLSQEVELFRNALEQAGQFVVGDFPQIFGGQSSNETVGQDEMAKAQALQRISTIWGIYNSFWAETKKKATTCYLNNLKKDGYDEKFVKKVGNSFINVWIRRADLGGEIGDVIPETSDQFPVTWAQKRGLYFQLLSMNKQPFDMAAFSPDNTQFTVDMLQLDGFHVPGQDDRLRQLSQIAELLKQAPMVNETGMPGPSIPPDPEIEDNAICIQTIRAWAVSLAGIDAQTSNPQGYANVRAQLSARLMIENMKAQEAAAAQPVEGEQKGAQSLPENNNGAIENPTVPPGGGI